MNILGNWEDFLPNETIELAKKLYEKTQQERNNGKVLFPSQDCIFRAFNGINPEDVKVVIVGQDPYHEEGQANGLSFSVNKGCKLPPSLQNIYRELAIEFGWKASPSHGDLTAWESKESFCLIRLSQYMREMQTPVKNGAGILLHAIPFVHV